MSETANRNLVCGWLAVQMQLISHETLEAALDQWQADTSTPLGQILVSTGFLTEENLKQLEAEVDRHICGSEAVPEDREDDLDLPTLELDNDGRITEETLRLLTRHPERVAQHDGPDSDLDAATVELADQRFEEATLPQQPPSPVTDHLVGDDIDAATIVVGDVVDSGGGDSDQTIPFATDDATLQVEPSHSHQQPAGNRADTPSPVAAQRYRVVRVHAEGGLGQVLLAVDTEFNRHVAFKQIKPRHAREPNSRARFLVEAEVTGRLEHPGIVPVYGLGQFADGRLYYAMRFIRGDSLHAAIKKYHQAMTPGPASTEANTVRPSDEPTNVVSARDEKNQQATALDTDGGTTTTKQATSRSSAAGQSSSTQVSLAADLEFRSLLRRMIDVCNTIEYAHSRRVLHRDIKPDNIMLGSFGETLVVDWGLAKVGDGESDTDATADGELPLTQLSGSNSAPTMAGSVIGTPAFMSPEQAAGKVQQLGPATDIYSIGATLYVLLTGQSPMHSGDKSQHLSLTDLLRNVREGKFRDPRDVNPHVPPPLDAICRKSMALEPEDRYPSALALAQDLEAWMADEPVTAWTEPPWLRARRWARQHQRLVTGFGVSLAVGLVAFVIVFVLVAKSHNDERMARFAAERAHQSERQARLAEAEARSNAVRRFREARSAVEASLTGVSEALKDFPEVQAVRERLLRQAADEYARLANDRSDDPELLAESARSLLRLGFVRMTLNETQAAHDAVAEAVELLEGLTQRSDAADVNEELHLDLARSHTLMATALQRLGETESAPQRFTQAIAILDQLIAARSDTTEDKAAENRLARADAQVQFAEALRETGQLAEAGTTLELADEEFTRNESPDDARFLHGHAKVLNSLTSVLIDQGRPADAVERSQQAWDVWSRLVELDADQPKFLEGRANARVLAIGALDSLTQGSARHDACIQAINDLEALTSALPDVPRYQFSLALTRTNLAQILNQRGLNPDAQEHAAGSLSVLLNLVDRFADRDTTAEAAAAQTMLAKVLLDLDESEWAVAHFDEALDKYTALTDAFPQIVRYQEDLAVCRSNAGRALHRFNQPAEAGRAIDLAIAELEELGKSMSPPGQATPPAYILNALAFAWTHKGDLLAEIESSDAALAAWSKALQLREQSADTPGGQLRLAQFLCHCPAASLRDPDRSLQIARQVTESTPTVAAAWSIQGGAHVRLMQWDRAIKALETSKQLRSWPDVIDGFLLSIANWQRNSGQDRETATMLFDRAETRFHETQPGRRNSILIHREARNLIRPASP